MTHMNTGYVYADQLESDSGGSGGDFLTGLDDGYVVEVEFHEHDVVVTFHTANGDEATLRCPQDMPITVKRHGDIPDLEERD